MSARPDLKSIEVRDYKAFQGVARLDLAPLTVVFGSNGSGKSALVRLPALVAAALRPEIDAEPGLPYRARGMSFGSSLLSVCHGGKLGLDGIGLDVDLGAQSLKVQIGRREGSPNANPAQWVESWTLRDPAGEISTSWDRRARRYSGSTFEQVRFEGLQPTIKGARPTGVVGVDPPHVEHIGPQRDPGRTDFIAAEPRPVWDVGFNGADTGRVLSSLDRFNYGHIVERIQDATARLLGTELRLERVGDAVSGTIVSARRSDRPTWLPLSELGTGLAHALPVIVALTAAAEAGPDDAPPTVLAIEEPEAHLHPRVHLELADLLLRTAQVGRTRCLIETHSETLILRLQRRVVEDPTLASLISLIWVDDEGGATTPRPLHIEADGTIPGWPDAWFDTAYQETMAISRARLSRGGR